ncbi:DUF1990 family protein [Actinomycetospora cinnamomea]|uniref:Uncharacterized protein DUF1990 n=1 Tax=Actinomycetospora cinnamomea TaxID=663609 RepID=A0A2U1F3W1_9PSEU|nr:DUF1990 family protein [Actinomycetospora cinnamomea]PVZ06875.1 uncharacterized protein DUF1990 [Actinomycetospora cinnamomea]
MNSRGIVHTRLLTRRDHVAALDRLVERPVNFSVDELGGSGWHHDEVRHDLGREGPGEPEPGGRWETACRLVRDYEFAAPEIIRAVYRRSAPLLGRDMLLEGRFLCLRFLMGVRVTEVVDTVGSDGDERVWGWAYDTLQGHLERGRMIYEVVKHRTTGRVEFVLRGRSQPADLGLVLRLGWSVFGRRTQLRFYRRCGEQLARLVAQAAAGSPPPEPRRDGDLVLAPSGVRPHPLEFLAATRNEPGG